ncbi:MAG TPA: hypothetical protein VLA21_01005 [Candidatus Limnocylindria bacterium]|nr:hypothetical protein [Candidatus Limnocylindria bacterium]
MKPSRNAVWFRLIPAALLAAALLFAGPGAVGEVSPLSAVPEGLVYTISAEPSSLTAPGPVTVSVSVSNAGAQDIQTPLSLYDPDGKPVTQFGDGGTLLRLASGESYPWQGQYSVTQAQLDAGRLDYTLRFSMPDASGALSDHTVPLTAQLTFTGEKVDLLVRRTITPEVVRRGREVTVLYDLINQGNVRLTNIQIRENRLISTRAQTVDALEPGATRQVTFAKPNVQGALTSSALVTYRKEGERTTREVTVAAAEIPLAAPGLTATLTPDRTQVNLGETVTLTLTIRNSGNITYSNVTVTEPTLGEVFSNVQIAAGQTRELKKEVTVTKTTNYAFSMRLEDNTGVTQTEAVPPVRVSAYSEGEMLRLNLMLTADREALSSIPGDIRFSLSVTNDSNTAARTVVIRHGGTVIYTINELAPGQTTVVTRDYTLSQAGKYQFTATALDVQDSTVSFESNPLNIGYVAPTAAPTRLVVQTIGPAVTHSPVPLDYAPQNAQLRSALFIVTLAVGALFGIALLLLLIGGLTRMRSRAKSNAAYDTFEVTGTRDYTAPAEPTRAPAVPVEEAAIEEKAPLAGPIQPPVREPIEMPHEKYLRRPGTPEPTHPPRPDGDQPPAASSDEEGAYRLVRGGDAETTGEGPQASPDADAPGEGRRGRRRRGDDADGA